MDETPSEYFLGFPRKLVPLVFYSILFCLTFYQYTIHVTLKLIKSILKNEKIKKYQLIICIIWGSIFSCIFNLISKLLSIL